MQFDAAGADDAVHRPGVDEVRLGGEVRAGFDVVVAGRDGVVEPAVGEACADGASHSRAPRHGERTALAEVVLDVDDDHRTHARHATLPC